MKPRRFIIPAIVLALVAWSLFGLEDSVARLYNAPHALRTLASDAWPADTSPGFMRIVGAALVETFQIAILATTLGGLLSLPLALIAASNLAPPWLVVPARLIAAAIRVLPSLLWAILAVLVFGLGPVAGVIAMTFYTIGYLSKLQYEALEGLPRDALDAVRAMGVGRFRQAWHVALPEASNALRSQLLFMLEYNVRASSIVGIVGAGGIGQTLGVALRFWDYNRVLTIVLAMFVTVALIDAVSFLVRRRFVEFSESRRPRWRDVLVPERT